MRKIIGTCWFTPLGMNELHPGCLGIVITENSNQQRKAWLGRCDGIDAEADKIFISNFGAKFPLEQAIEICKQQGEFISQ